MFRKSLGKGRVAFFSTGHGSTNTILRSKLKTVNLMFIGPCIIAIVDEWKTNFMSLAILFHLLCAQHVSDINISIFRSLRLCWWITTSVVLFSVCCVLELLLRLVFGGVRFARWSVLELLLRLVFGGVRFAGWSVLQPAKRTPPDNSRNKSSNTQRTENKTTDVVIHQHSRKLLKMDILMSETCWAHNKWNKIASDIKLVFHSSRSRMLGVYRCACRVLCCGTVETLFSLSQRIKTFISFICCNVLWCGLRKICRVFMHLTSWLYWAACSSLFIFNTDL